MDSDILILYIDSDFIYPLVSGGDGSGSRYYNPDPQKDDGRLWLYFFMDSVQDRLLWQKSYKNDYFSGKAGYLGEFWKNLDKDKRPELVADTASYALLLKKSSILADIKELYVDGGKRRQVNIPTAYIFAANISLEARKRFIAFMEENGFATESYSVPFEALMLAYSRMIHPNRAPQFGEKALAYYSSGDDMICTACAWDGDKMMRICEPEILAGDGLNPVYMALVQFVVSQVERQNDFLRNDKELAQEIAYQLQWAGQWLEKAKNAALFSVPFRYQKYGDREYPVNVQKSQLDKEVSERIGDLLRKMERFRASHIQNDMFEAVLCGEMFDNEDFRRTAIRNIGDADTVTVLDPGMYSAIIKEYFACRPDQNESLKDFNKVANEEKSALKYMKLWLQNAEKLRQIEAMSSQVLEDANKTFDLFIQDAQRACDDAIKALQTPTGLFDEAFSLLEGPRDRNRAALERVGKSFDNLKREIKLSQSILDDINKLKSFGAKRIIDRIKAQNDKIVDKIKEYEEARKAIEAWRDETTRLKGCYDEYMNLKEELLYATGKQKREIIKDIQDRLLTREPLPIIKLTRPFNAVFNATLKIEGIFFKKKKSILVSLDIAEGSEAECEMVVIVRDQMLVSINERDVRAHIHRGASGRQEFTLQLPMEGLDPRARRLYIYLKPDPKEAIPIDSLGIAPVEINL